MKKLGGKISKEKKDEIQKEIIEEKKEEEINKKENEEIENYKNKLYENEFDKIIINIINGKNVENIFKIEEYKIISNEIIKKYQLITNSYLKNKNITEKDTENYAEYKGIVNKLNSMPDSRIDKLLNVNINNKQQKILSYYELNDRKIIINLLNNELFNNSKKIIKTIYYPKASNVDIIAIEDVFKDNEKEINIFYDMIKNEIKESNNDDKINKLINSKIVIPIVSDFMWIDNPNEIYKIDKTHKVKKESEEKIFYIINKINQTTSKLENNDNSIINDNLKFKNAIYYSMVENNNIINDNLFTSNQMIKSNIDFLLEHQYNPYFNLKSKYYFNYYFTNTLTAIRLISIEEKNSKYISKNQKIQLRTNNNYNFNIVGFMIYDGLIDNIKYSDLNEINYNKFLDCVNDKLNNNNFKGGYWLFSENDKNRIVNFNEDLDNNLLCKKLTELLYDDVNNIHNKIIINKIKKCLSYDEMLNVIKSELLKFYPNQVDNKLINEDLLTLSDEDKEYIDIKMEEIENGIFNFLNSHNKELKDKYDILYGFENINKLKEAKYLKSPETVNIDLTDETYLDNIKKDELEGYICQHHISLDDIKISKKNKNYNYQNLFSSFVSSFVEIDVHGKYICKSCNQLIPEIEDYAQEIVKSGNKLVITGAISIGKIEDDEKYKDFIGIDGVINNIKNNIIKVADFVNIPQYAIKSKKTENAINQLTKDTIDLLQNTLSIWNKKYLEYNNIKEQKYGIIRILSDLFIWPFDNNLYKNDTVYKDINKLNKQNNAILYVAINLINAISKDQIINLTKNKDCNYSVYENFSKFFNNCKIQITKEQISPIINYPVLGYTIFNFAFNLVKYNRFNDLKGREKNSKLKTELILKAFYTICDIMNVINLIYFDLADTNENSDIFNFYQRYYLNFLNHLNIIYSDNSFISSLRFDNNKQYDIVKYINNDVLLTDKIEDYYDVSIGIKNIKVRNYHNLFDVSINNKFIEKDKINYNDLINNKFIFCPDGKIHKWKNNNVDIFCSKCNISYNQLIKSKEYDNLNDNIKYEFLQILANRYCINAKKHKFILVKDKRICELCKYEEGTKLNKNELNKLKDNYYKSNIIDNESYNDDENIKIISDYNILKKEFDTFKKYVKNNYNIINENNITINLNDISYTVNHTYNGIKLDNPYILSDKEVIHTELNGKKVLMFKEKSVNVYYDENSLKLIGHIINNKFTPYNGYIDYHLIINYDIQSFIENLFLPKYLINVYYLSYEDVFYTYYSNLIKFINGIILIVNKINNNNKNVDIDKIINFNTYLINRSNILDIIVSSYNGNKKFNINNKCLDILKLGFEKYNKKFLDIKQPEAFENSIKLFKENNFNDFKIFSLIILMKLLNSLLIDDNKFIKQIIKFIIYTYLSNYQNDYSKYLLKFTDEIYAPAFIYGDMNNINIDYETNKDDNKDDNNDETKYIDDAIDIDKFQDVDEDGNIIEDDEDNNNIIID